MTLNFLHVMQEKEFEIDFGGSIHLHDVSLTIHRHTWTKAGNRDEYWDLEVSRLKVMSINGHEDKALLVIFQTAIDEMLENGQLNVEIECLNSENEVAV